MTDVETVDYLEAQLRVAQKLGFHTMRLQFGARPSALRLIAPAAEQARVKLEMEIHAPHSVDHPKVIALRELFDEIDSAYLGFIPDFGASMRAIPAGAVAQQRDLGMPEALIARIVGVWEQVRRGESEPFAARRALMGALEAERAHPNALQFAWRALKLWGTQAGCLGRDHAPCRSRPREVVRHRRAWRGAVHRLCDPDQGVSRRRIQWDDQQRVGRLCLGAR